MTETTTLPVLRRRTWFVGDEEPPVDTRVLWGGQVWMRHPRLHWILWPGGNGCPGIEWWRFNDKPEMPLLEVFPWEQVDRRGGLVRVAAPPELAEAWRKYTVEPSGHDAVGTFVLCRDDDVCDTNLLSLEGQYLTLGEAFDFAVHHAAQHAVWEAQEDTLVNGPPARLGVDVTPGGADAAVVARVTDRRVVTTVFAPLAPWDLPRGRTGEMLDLAAAIRRYGDLRAGVQDAGEHASPQEAEQFAKQAEKLLGAIAPLLPGAAPSDDQVRVTITATADGRFSVTTTPFAAAELPDVCEAVCHPAFGPCCGGRGVKA